MECTDRKAAFRPRLKGGLGAPFMEPFSKWFLSEFRSALTIPFRSLLLVEDDYKHRIAACQQKKCTSFLSSLSPNKKILTKYSPKHMTALYSCKVEIGNKLLGCGAGLLKKAVLYGRK